MDDIQQETSSISKQQKIRLIDMLLEDFQETIKTPLQFVIDFQPFYKFQTDDHKNSNIVPYRQNYKYQLLHTYVIPGSKIVRRTQNNNLISKIQKFQKSGYQQTKVQKKSVDKKNITKKQHEENQQLQIPEQIDKKSEEQLPEQQNQQIQHQYRYYKNDNVICFKCKKIGHYLNMCPQADTCLFCLSSQHLSQECPQKNVCYKCYKCGHMISQCSSKDVYMIKCAKCQRNHEGQCCFLTKGKERTKKMFRVDHLYQNKDIKCPKCLKYGHIDCLY